jgi:hypothetical protein
MKFSFLLRKKSNLIAALMKISLMENQIFFFFFSLNIKYKSLSSYQKRKELAINLLR